MVAEMVEKPLTEAQRLIARLEDEFGLAQAEIAQAIRVKPDTIFDIKRRKTTGNIQLRGLRRLIAATESSGNPAEYAGGQFPAFPLPEGPAHSGSGSASDEAAQFTLNGEEPPQAPEKPFRERAGDFLRAAMLGEPNVETPKTTKKLNGAVEPSDLADQLVPTVALIFVLSGELLIPDPYKPVGPTHQEAMAITYPIIKRLARELDARKKLSEDSMEMVGILVAMTAYGVRARGTYKQIHAMEVERVRSHNDAGANGAATYVQSSGPASSPTATSGDAGASQRGADAGAPVAFGRRAGAAGAASGGAGRGASGGRPDTHERQANALLDDLLAQDASGRARLGLG